MLVLFFFVSFQVSGAWYITDIDKSWMNEWMRLPDKANVYVIIFALLWPEAQIMVLRILWLTNQWSTDNVSRKK